MLNDEVHQLINESVLCWLATSSTDGQPNVSPKEIFAAYNNDSIIIANIASPTTAKNIRENPKACVSFINIFTQKGFQVSGSAAYLTKDDLDYADIEQQLTVLTGGNFPFKSAFRIHAEQIREVIAPRYRLFPDTTESDQIKSAMQTYGVQPRA